MGDHDRLVPVRADGPYLNCDDLLHDTYRTILPAEQRLATVRAVITEGTGLQSNDGLWFRLPLLLCILSGEGLPWHLKFNIRLPRSPLHSPGLRPNQEQLCEHDSIPKPLVGSRK